MLLARHNRKCVIAAIGWILLSPFGWISAWWFFYYVFDRSLKRFDIVLPSYVMISFAVICMLVLCSSAWTIWKQQTSLSDDFVNWNQRGLTEESGGAVAVNFYTAQVTAPALLASRLFLLGPISLLRARDHWHRRLPNDEASERRLSDKLLELQKIAKWQGLADHPGEEISIFQLAQMRLIDFSTKPSVRFKAKQP